LSRIFGIYRIGLGVEFLGFDVFTARSNDSRVANNSTQCMILPNRSRIFGNFRIVWGVEFWVLSLPLMERID
jgi:hypothetical protein